uniref:Cytochrome c oxidase subunit 8B, mitochondrial-like n=2 Tax=Sinocyclocheilus grahami TaxID=75366 RepID=A0A672PSQ1_SINGR
MCLGQPIKQNELITRAADWQTHISYLFSPHPDLKKDLAGVQETAALTFPVGRISRPLEPCATGAFTSAFISNNRTMSGLNRSLNLLRGVLRHQIIHKANISAKPAKHVLSAGEQVFVMMTMFVTILGPSGWVLAHLEDYKKRPGGAE